MKGCSKSCWYERQSRARLLITVKNMTSEEQKHYIDLLVKSLEKAELGLRARDAVLQDFLDKQKEFDERLSKLDEIESRIDLLKKALEEKDRQLKAAERKVADLTARLNASNKNHLEGKKKTK